MKQNPEKLELRILLSYKYSVECCNWDMTLSSSAVPTFLTWHLTVVKTYLIWKTAVIWRVSLSQLFLIASNKEES